MIQVVPASNFDDAALAACFTAAFDGYLAGAITMDAAALPRFLRRQGAERALSRVVVRDGVPSGVAFVGEYPGPAAGPMRRRLCAMGVRPGARGSGASRALLRRVIDEARDAAAQALELEVFVQNEPAVRLYRSAGFIDGPPLWGFARAPGDADAPDAAPQAVGLVEAAAWLRAHGPADLPYQVSASALPAMDPPPTAWRLGTALLAFTRPAEQRLQINALVDAQASQRDALGLVRTLVARHRGHAIHVPQLMRDDVAAQALRDAGFETLALHQMQMRLPLG